MCESRLAISKNKSRSIQNSQEKFRNLEKEGDILIFDTCFGSDGTTTIRVCHVFE